MDNKTIDLTWKTCVQMKKEHELYVRKALGLSKLALAIVLLFVVVKAVILPLRGTTPLGPASVSGAEDIRPVEVTKPTDTSVQDYSAIFERNIFGNPETSLNAKIYSQGDSAGGLGQSAGQELGLALLGTLAGSPMISRAIIKDLKTNTVALYRVGDTVSTARIDTIEKDVVVLLDGGQRKILSLWTSESKQKSSEHNLAHSSNNADESLGTAEADSIVMPKPAARAEQTDIDKTLRKAVIQPVFVNGQTEGLMITGVEDTAIAKKLGLKDGDVIRVVNGQRLTSKQQAYQVLKKAGAQPSVDLELSRGNNIKTLSFPLREAASD
ncbi:MAG: PDZ domain-containing protein [Sedimentisphaerales bacterium]|nr:PDZ domain-containing protein [Sedimentisphaerales bacterium]